MLPPSLPSEWSPRRQYTLRGIDASLRTLSQLSRFTAGRWLRRIGVQIHRNVVYQSHADKAHRLDIYRPQQSPTPTPVVFYVHGGGFSILSKDTHWLMALAFARLGYLVVNIDYRLAPRDPFPAALADTCAAYAWVMQHIHAYGGDPGRMFLAGESAGANLVTGLTLALCYQRPEPFAQAAFKVGMPPRAVLPACGILQVSDPERFRRRKAHLPPFIHRRIAGLSQNYLSAGASAMALADPLFVLEEGGAPARPLPPFFIPVGTRDPVLDDSRRLKAALDKLHVPAELRYYTGGVHAFHAMLWRPLARQCWADMAQFITLHL